MGRTPCCVKVGLNRGPWTADEDLRLSNYVETHGEGGWRILPKKAGLLRCGKSCRLRWMNYLRPDVKRGKILPEEEDLILRLHRLLGNRWSLIAGRMPGRTDNEIKNYWNTHLSKKLITQGIDPRTHKPLSVTHDLCAISEENDISPKILKISSPLGENFADPGTSDTAAAPATVKVSGSAPRPQKNNVSESNSEAPCVPTAVNCINKHLPLPTTLVKSGDLDMPYLVQPDTNNIGSNQISFAPFMTTTSEAGGVAHNPGDNYVTNSCFTSSFEIRRSYSSQSAPFFGQWNSSDGSVYSGSASFQKRQVSQGLQALEMELHNSGIVPPLITAYSKLSNANCVGTAFSLPTCMGSAFGDCSSDMFSSFLESFANEEMQATAAQPCPNQSDPANLSYDLWSLLSPTAQYHRSI